MTPEFRETVNLALDAVTSIGTLAAVVVALYLARDSKREVITARAGLRRLVNMGQTINEGEEIIDITITNRSFRPITVTGVGWRVGIFKRQHFAQIIDYANPLSFRLPCKLEYSDSASFPMNSEDFFKLPKESSKAIALFWPWFSRKFIYLIVSTSGGNNFLFRVEDGLARKFCEEAKKQRQT